MDGVASDCSAALRKTNQVDGAPEQRLSIRRIPHWAGMSWLWCPLLSIIGWENPEETVASVNGALESELVTTGNYQLSTSPEANSILKGDMSGALLWLSAVLDTLFLLYSRFYNV